MSGNRAAWLLVLAASIPAVSARGEEAPRPARPAPEAKPKASPPRQPEKGFGGADYPHASYRVASLGKGGEQIWIFEPTNPLPAGPAPVVLFLHGWSAMDPTPYGAWVRHLVRKGNIVLYPRYQEALATPPPEFTPALLASVRAAWAHLEGRGDAATGRAEGPPDRTGREDTPVRPDPARVAVVGHSFGGALAMQYAALAAKEKLPPPKAVMPIEPGTGEERFPRLKFDFADMSAISKDTLLLMVVGDRDRLVADVTAARLWKEARHIPGANRDYLVFRSDEHGAPPLVAGHLFPVAGDEAILDPSAPPRPSAHGMFGTDALDWRGTWRLFDALEAAAFTGQGRDQCLGGTDAQKDLGRWSDGVPVKPPLVTDDPESPGPPGKRESDR